MSRGGVALLLGAVCVLAGTAVAPAAVAADPAVTVNVDPASPQVQQQVTVSGTVTDASGNPVSGAMLGVTRTDSAGDNPLPPDTTDGSGHYDFTDTPTAYGDNTWTVTWSSGNVSGQQTVTVTRRPTEVSIRVDDTTVRSGHDVHVTAHLGSPTTSRELSIYARPYGQSRELVEQGTVDETGDLTATFTVDRRTRLVAAFHGDDTYAPATAAQAVRARGVVTNHLSGWYEKSNGYRIFHVGADPTLRAHLRPEFADACLYFRAQHYYGGRWHGRALSDCQRTGSGGRVSRELTGDHVINDPYRVRVEWHGAPIALAASGPWIRLRFRG